MKKLFSELYSLNVTVSSLMNGEELLLARDLNKAIMNNKDFVVMVKCLEEV